MQDIQYKTQQKQVNKKCVQMNDLTTPNLAVKNRTHLFAYSIVILYSNAKHKKNYAYILYYS